MSKINEHLGGNKLKKITNNQIKIATQVKIALLNLLHKT